MRVGGFSQVFSVVARFAARIGGERSHNPGFAPVRPQPRSLMSEAGKERTPCAACAMSPDGASF
jgi:hypothetical protein